jgi:hypothetical protein
MPNSTDQQLLEALLDSWDRSNAILINLLRVIQRKLIVLISLDTIPRGNRIS